MLRFEAPTNSFLLILAFYGVWLLLHWVNKGIKSVIVYLFFPPHAGFWVKRRRVQARALFGYLLSYEV